GLHRSWAGERGADEADPDRLEFGRRQPRRRISGPERMAVAGHDRESGDLRVADESGDLTALVVRASVVAAPDLRERAGGPFPLGHAIGQVLWIGSQVERAK